MLLGMPVVALMLGQAWMGLSSPTLVATGGHRRCKIAGLPTVEPGHLDSGVPIRTAYSLHGG